MRTRTLLPLVAAAALLLQACGDATGPGFGPVPEEPGQATVFDFRTSSVREASAFDAVSAQTVRTDQSAGWDFLFAVRDDGTAELRPRDSVLGNGAVSGLQPVDASFGGLDEAPEGGYTTGSAVEIEQGDVLAGRSRQDSRFSIGCNHFLKVEILELDAAAGTLTFRHLINPACGRRNLVPGSSNQD